MASVHQANTSEGGVPKLPRDTAVIDESGIVGDMQADQVHHGSPDQALCLYSLEVIEELQAEGHPISPGSAGENLTISGLDWGSLELGQRLSIGPEAIVEITWHATPCQKNAQWFCQRRHPAHVTKPQPWLFASLRQGAQGWIGEAG